MDIATVTFEVMHEGMRYECVINSTGRTWVITGLRLTVVDGGLIEDLDHELKEKMTEEVGYYADNLTNADNYPL